MRAGARLIAVTIAAALLTITLPGRSFAMPANAGYTYDQKQHAVASTNGYSYADSIDGYDSESGPFQGIEDLFAAPDGTLYIADSGKNRVVRLDSAGKLVGLYGTDSGSGKLNKPKGVHVAEDGTVYVADTGNARIAVFHEDGTFLKEFRKPESALLGSDFQLLPSKLIVDKRGYMFIVSEGLTRGLLQLNANGEFAGLFGANRVPFSLSRSLTKLIATPEQKAQMAGTKPPEFSNLVQDKKGFIYTTTLGIETEQIKRLSAVGVDTLNKGRSTEARYGDYAMRSKDGVKEIAAFSDLAVDSQGFITAIDQVTGRAFHYDSLGNLLFVFGGLGELNGLFLTPSAIAVSSDGSIYVADKMRNRIDRFRLTPFGEKVREASVLFANGRYEEAQKPWREVLRLNSNYDMAYWAIGKSLYKQENYRDAMHYLKLAGVDSEYSEAFSEYRKIVIRRYLPEAVMTMIILFVLLKTSSVLYRRRKRASRPLEKGGES